MNNNHFEIQLSKKKRILLNFSYHELRNYKYRRLARDTVRTEAFVSFSKHALILNSKFVVIPRLDKIADKKNN